MIQLLSPAGNLEKLRYVYLYGADAAYIGLAEFSLRSRADNFTYEDSETVRAIKRDKKLYGALNIFMHDADLRSLRESLDALSQFPFDALIVSDPGAIALLKKELPHMPLHLSTQANCLNSDAARWYRDIGFTRLILARELSLSQIARIRKEVPDVELEVFVHGAMCWAYSGRCYLSQYLADRSANAGDCAHSCRWHYRVLEEQQRPGEYLPIEEHEDYTAIISSRDLCMADHIPKLVDAGVDSLKIEGRMKSLYYAAVTTRSYRKLIDSALGEKVPDLKIFREDLNKIRHREYSTGFYFGDSDSVQPAAEEYLQEYAFLGTVGEKISPDTFVLEIKNQILASDTLEYISPSIPAIEDRTFVLLDANNHRVEKADHGKPFSLKTQLPVQKGFILRKRISQKP